MGHLEEVGMGYFGHLRLAWLNSLRLGAASVALAVHGAFPFLLAHFASETLEMVQRSFPKRGRERILVRFNTKWKDDPEGRQWRVLINGSETLARGVSIKTGSETVEEEVQGEQKFHFLCFGRVLWKEGFAEIV